mgnify:CR=1 FL=1
MNEAKSYICGKNKKPEGVAPAVLLINPKYDRNVGAAQRACSCFGVHQLWWTGDRVTLEVEKGQRLPREERMKGYKDVELRQHDYPFDEFPGCTPVAIEVRENSEMLTDFVHPENPLYVFGPEDGSIPRKTLQHCHRFVVIPTRHCTNLAAAVYIMLYDRMLKQHLAGEDVNLFTPGQFENRGWANEDEYMNAFG